LKKILVIRFSSIGDIVLTTPVIRSIKTQLDCRIDTVTKSANAHLYENNPYVNKVFGFENSETEVISRLKDEQYDFVVDLQKNLRSYKIKKALKVASASFPKVNIEKWLLVNLKVNYLPEVHVVTRYFKAVEPLGVTNDGEGPDFFIPAKDEVDVTTIDKRLEKGYVGFVVGGQHFTKIFPPEKAAQVINKLDLPVVLLGGKEDYERGREVIKRTPGKAVFNACGRFNLNQSASLVKQCRVLITNDTGLMHIGAAFNKPMVSIWGNTVPAFGMYPYMPRNKDRFYISEVKNLSCRPCSKLGYSRCPKKHFKCMMEQDVDAIVKRVGDYYI
jgi:ADP-heptose:LPS heptosyltransferase